MELLSDYCKKTNVRENAIHRTHTKYHIIAENSHETHVHKINKKSASDRQNTIRKVKKNTIQLIFVRLNFPAQTHHHVK